MEEPSARNRHLLLIEHPAQPIRIGNDIGKRKQMRQKSGNDAGNKRRPARFGYPCADTVKEFLFLRLHGLLPFR